MWPSRAGRAGGDLTWKAANGPGYERVGRGLYLPTDRRRSVEQRIVDAAARLPKAGVAGVVTGWAALRWRGANYFDGLTADGGRQVPVELMVPIDRNLRDWPGVTVHRRLIGPREREVVDGLPVATVARALFDEIATRGDLWAGVQAIDMTAAARLTSALLFATFVGECNSRLGAPLVRDCVELAVDESLSPRETWARLVWTLVAHLDEPLVNQPVYDLRGRLIGVPDLFDPVTGLACEYSGEVHRSAIRHRQDVTREERFRSHGLEYVELVSGDSRSEAAARILAARGRSLLVDAEHRRWTTERPVWDPAPETLDGYLERTGQVERLVACDSAHPDSPLRRRTPVADPDEDTRSSAWPRDGTSARPTPSLRAARTARTAGRR